MLSSERVYMLAADHRWQWEEWCDARGLGRARIGEAKALVLDAFRAVRAGSEEVRRFGSLLLDECHAARLIPQAMAEGIEVGTPAEKAGAFPLEWSAHPFHRDLTGTFVKVLVRHRPDHAPDLQREQRRRLRDLQSWCAEHGRPLLVEILVPAAKEEDERALDERRPEIVADYIRSAYREGLVPQLWKVEGTASEDGAARIDEAVAAREGARHVILGKGADLAEIAAWFAAARRTRTAAGFAIGRSTYWGPATQHLAGALPRADAVLRIADGYRELVRLWSAA